MTLINGNLVQAPLNQRDIQGALGLSSSVNKWSQLCTHNNINMWAKYKPVSYNVPANITLSQRQNVNYGIINIPTWSNINNMANFWFGVDTSSTNAPDIGIQSIYWGYQKPVGGSSSPYRALDFNGYYHDAEAPIGGSVATEYNIQSSGTLVIAFSYGAQDSDTIALSDLSYPRQLSLNIGNMHFGVMLRNTSTGTVYAVTRSDTISTVITNVTITGLSSSFNGDYQIFPFLSSDVISFTSSLGQYTNGDFIAIRTPETVGIGVTIVRMDVVEQSLYANRITSTSTKILYTGFIIKNVNSGQGTARVTFEVFDVNNNLLASNMVLVPRVNAGATASVVGNVDMQTLAKLRLAYSVRVTVTPTNVSNYAVSSDNTTVTENLSPFD